GFALGYPLDGWTGGSQPLMRVSRHSALGLQFERAKDEVAKGDPYTLARTFTFRWACPFALTALLPSLIFIRRIRTLVRHRCNPCSGSCPIWSYKLTGTTSGACPECGTAVGKEGK